MPFKKGHKPPKKSKHSKKPAKKKLVFKPANGEFRPFFVQTRIATAKDGVIRDVRAVRVKGRPDSESAKKVDMALLDPKTNSRFVARLCGSTFIRSEKKRLPGNAQFTATLRVGKSNKDGGIRVQFKKIGMRVSPDSKKVKLLSKKNPMYRAIRKSNRFLPAAFVDAVPFPGNKELKALLKSAGKEA